MTPADDIEGRPPHQPPRFEQQQPGLGVYETDRREASSNFSVGRDRQVESHGAVSKVKGASGETKGLRFQSDVVVKRGADERNASLDVVVTPRHCVMFWRRTLVVVFVTPFSLLYMSLGIGGLVAGPFIGFITVPCGFISVKTFSDFMVKLCFMRLLLSPVAMLRWWIFGLGTAMDMTSGVLDRCGPNGTLGRMFAVGPFEEHLQQPGVGGGAYGDNGALDPSQTMYDPALLPQYQPPV